MKEKVLFSIEIETKAAFQDLDIMHVVWHGRYWKFVEQARQALFDALDFGYEKMLEYQCQFPIVKANIKYIRPIGLNQHFLVKAELLEFENRVKIRFIFRDKESSDILAVANSMQVAVFVGDNTLQFITPDYFQKSVNQALSVNV